MNNKELIEQINNRLDRIEQCAIIGVSDMITCEQAAIILGCNKEWVYDLTKDENPVLSFSKEGKRKYVAKADVLEYKRRNLKLGRIGADLSAEEYLKTHKVA